MRHESVRLKAAWICLLIVGVGILAFGVVAAVFPGSGNAQLMRADGVAATGMGLFGVLITLVPFRRGERWAWYAQWFYPVFWIAHLVGGLPPGKDHVHQVVFIVLSLAGLLLPARVFFPRATPTG
ncbi:hypothetical protein AV521_45610 [Streptomyces sp. IMTB 2501]|uniref:hypothetical protein n=1 Tax=Streptomyces sp. IMTB 2501 TaxID=1776340 RepID=UPI00096C2594|nr:hypothetical protein [Streptomyces sp. IMTB 2501]OLZ59329.1 hypothetical protein AV521_45610 [Streptomyces sp. IMTB 2501]